MRVVLALVLAIAGCKRVTTEDCTKRVDAVEARIRGELKQLAALGVITERVDEDSRKALPVVPTAEGTFELGFALWFNPGVAGAQDAFERVIAAEACQKREGPLRLYLAGDASPETEAGYGERAAWLAAASAAWKVPIEARRVVRLATERDLFPWPEHSDRAQKLAKEVFAVKFQPNLDKLKAAVQSAHAGCDAIGKHAAAEDATNDDRVLALPRGLRECGCAVPDLDNAIGTWHLMSVARTDLGWQRISPTTTNRPVPPLACAEPIKTTLVRGRDRWTTPPLQLEELIKEARELLDSCRMRSPLGVGEIVQLWVTPSVGGTGLEAYVQGSPAFREIQDCVQRPTREGTEALDGSTTIEIYVPAGKPPV